MAPVKDFICKAATKKNHNRKNILRFSWLHSTSLHLGPNPSHCHSLYITCFILLGYFANSKFRLHAGKWIYPWSCLYQKWSSIHQKVLPVPHHHLLDSAKPWPYVTREQKQQWGNWPGEWLLWATKPMLKRSEYTSNTIRILSICSKVRATGCTRTILMANTRSQQTTYFVLGHSFPNRLHVEAVPFQNKSRTWPCRAPRI